MSKIVGIPDRAGATATSYPKLSTSALGGRGPWLDLSQRRSARLVLAFSATVSAVDLVIAVISALALVAAAVAAFGSWSAASKANATTRAMAAIEGDLSSFIGLIPSCRDYRAVWSFWPCLEAGLIPRR